MNTEITDKNGEKPVGWIFYDAQCAFCVRGVKRWNRIFSRRGFCWLPMQTLGTSARLGVAEERLFEEMWVQHADGRAVSGVRAWSELMRKVWWLWPLGVLLCTPGVNSIAKAVYRWIARNRYCFGGSCKIDLHRPMGLRAGDMVGLAVIIAIVIFVGRAWPAWVLMWALGVSLGLFGKYLTWRDARGRGLETRLRRSIGWFLLWPGLDGRAFFAAERGPVPPLREWFGAIFKLGLGVFFIWIVGPRWLSEEPLALGWCGMVGIVLVLHFGGFQLLSLAWRCGGVNAAPIMNRPLAATSLAQLWSERWNTAFSIPSRRLLLLPLTRRIGVSVVSFAVFAASGLLHELVISIPARDGYGLPTAYFLLQGAGVWLERTKAGRALGLGSGIRGWLFTLVTAAGPVFWLFHPAFVRNVILPMLEAIGAT